MAKRKRRKLKRRKNPARKPGKTRKAAAKERKKHKPKLTSKKRKKKKLKTNFRRVTKKSTANAAKAIIKRTEGKAGTTSYVLDPKGKKEVRKRAIKLLKQTKKGQAWLKKYLECGYEKTLSGKPCSRSAPGKKRCWQHKNKSKKRKHKKHKRKLRRKKR